CTAYRRPEPRAQSECSDRRMMSLYFRNPGRSRFGKRDRAHRQGCLRRDGYSYGHRATAHRIYASLIPVWRACWPGDAPGNFLKQTVCFSDLISNTLSLNSLSSFSHRFGISNCRHQFVWTNIYVMVDDYFMNNSHEHP